MFSIRFKELRKNKKLSQAVVAKIFGVAASTVGMWEAGKRNPDYNMLVRIADFFNVSTDYLLDKSNGKSISMEIIPDKNQMEITYEYITDSRLLDFYSTNINKLIDKLIEDKLLNIENRDEIKAWIDSIKILKHDPIADISNKLIKDLNNEWNKQFCSIDYLNNFINENRSQIYERYISYLYEILFYHQPYSNIVLNNNTSEEEIKSLIHEIAGDDVHTLAKYYSDNYIDNLTDHSIEIILSRLSDMLNRQGKIKLSEQAEVLTKVPEFQNNYRS